MKPLFASAGNSQMREPTVEFSFDVGREYMQNSQRRRTACPQVGYSLFHVQGCPDLDVAASVSQDVGFALELRWATGRATCERDAFGITGTHFLDRRVPLSNRDFRNSWKLSARTAVKTLERLRSFLKFCVESEWLDKNPAAAIKPGKVEDAEVLPFSQPQVDKILKACDSFNGNGDRIRALANLMLATGLRIGDASTISRDRFVKDGDGWKVILRTVKTGTSVCVPVQDSLVKQIQALPGQHPFWSGQSTPEDCSSVWQEAFRKLFKHAGISGHPHQFRHTFAKNLLVAEVPLETVSVLLGHRKLGITEKHYARFVPERQASIDRQVRKSWARGGHTSKTRTVTNTKQKR
jgi:integrase